MGCLLGLVSLITPRAVMLVMWVFTDYLSRAFGSFFWPFMGFFFLPTTTIAYAVAKNEFGGVRGGGFAVLIVGIAVDLGLVGGARGIGKRFQDRRPRQ